MSDREQPEPSRDEFQFIAADAERVGRREPLPAVSRVSAPIAGDRQVSALRFDAAQEPALVTLHGAGLNAHSWDPVLFALNVPALSLDLPGHGHSSWREDADYRPDNLATDIEQALDSLLPTQNERSITAIGHSLGGLTAALLAAAQPEMVRALIVVDITPGVTPATDAESITAFIHGKREFSSRQEMVDRAISFGIGTDRAALTRGVVLNSRQRADGTWEWAHHFAHLAELPGEPGDPQPYAPIWGSLQTLDVPITLIRAGEGMLTDDHVAEWRSQLPSSSVVTVPGPHNLHEAAPIELASAIRDATEYDGLNNIL